MKPLWSSFGITILDDEVVSGEIAKIAQCSMGRRHLAVSLWSAEYQDTQTGNLWLLRARWEWPHHRDPAKKPDELAPPDVEHGTSSVPAVVIPAIHP
jgi:hypothetical protein